MALISTIVYVLAILAAVWVIYDVWAVNKKLDQTWKIIWTVLAVIFSIITAIIYYFLQKR